MSRAGGPGSGRPPKRKGLTAEDEALWDWVTVDYEPVKGLKARVHTHEGSAAEEGAPQRHPLQHSRPPVRANGHPAPPRPIPPPAAPAYTKPPPLAEFDRRKAKKIAAGREPIDARIDLHGMRQSEAHSALRAFLLTNYSKGHRNLLVITGKGGPVRDEVEPTSFMDTRERGVLKRNVPMWLAEPELRAIVVSFREAAQSHGGAGALYIHLRARRRIE